MTKKSAGRVQRNLAEAEDKKEREANTLAMGHVTMPNNTWDQLHSLYADSVKLFQRYHRLAAMMTVTEIVKNMLPREVITASNLIKGMASDTTQLRKDTDAVYNTHKHKFGLSKGDRDWMAIVGLFQDYAALFQRHELEIQPAAHQLYEIIQDATNRSQGLPTSTALTAAEIMQRNPQQYQDAVAEAASSASDVVAEVQPTTEIANASN